VFSEPAAHFTALTEMLGTQMLGLQ
jgi:hypothetical protein